MRVRSDELEVSDQCRLRWVESRLITRVINYILLARR